MVLFSLQGKALHGTLFLEWFDPAVQRRKPLLDIQNEVPASPVPEAFLRSFCLQGTSWSSARGSAHTEGAAGPV